MQQHCQQQKNVMVDRRKNRGEKALEESVFIEGNSKKDNGESLRQKNSLNWACNLSTKKSLLSCETVM